MYAYTFMDVCLHTSISTYTQTDSWMCVHGLIHTYSYLPNTDIDAHVCLQTGMYTYR